MGGVAKPSEHRVRCLSPFIKSDGDAQLRLSIDGNQVGIKLSISHLNAHLVAELPDRALDLLEVAAVVYGADAAVSRGGTADQQMGAKWHRHFEVEMPVRDCVFWQDNETVMALEEMLMFLSGDRFVFRFTRKNEMDGARTPFFKFDENSAWRATRVMMFSGGLDSFAGALEEIAEQGQRVALVSHFSASKIAPTQRNLYQALVNKFGAGTCRHIRVQVQMVGSGLKEGSHRARSFLFAALGAVAAQAFGLQRVSFHENGVVSLNLPPVGNVLGTRATRTTHPQTMAHFSGFLGRVFAAEVRVDNPYFWRTKKDVVELIARLGMSDQIAHTRSCADVHNQTRQYPHCGRCSQCIDRRFAILAAGLERFDPEEAYRVALMTDPRNSLIDREIALSYLRTARAYEQMTATDLERSFPAVLSTVAHLDQPPDTALAMVTQMLKRHGKGVSGVLRQAFGNGDAEDFPEASLPRLYGEEERRGALPMIEAPTIPAAPLSQIALSVDERARRVVIDGRVTIARNATADILIALAGEWLVGAGQGLDPLDFPFVGTTALAKKFGLEEEALRRRVMRARTELRRKFASAGMNDEFASELIESQVWHGYRLCPDQVTIRRVVGET